MKNWTIGKRIILGIVSVILIAVALGLFAYSRLINIHTYSNAIVNDALPGVYFISKFESNERQAQINTFKHILSDSKEEKTQFKAAIASILQTNEKLMVDYERTITAAKDRELFAEIQTAFPTYRKAQKEVLELSDQGKGKEAFAMSKTELQPTFEKLMAAIEADVNFNKENGDELTKSIQTAIGSAQTGILIGLTMTLLVGSGIAFVIIRGTSRVLGDIATRLGEGSDQVASAASQVSSSSQSLAEGASQHACFPRRNKRLGRGNFEHDQAQGR